MVLNRFRESLLLILVGRLFQSLAAETAKEFSYKVPFVLGTLSFPSPVDRKFLVCTSDALTNKSVIYSGAKSFRPLYTIIHVWYCTRYGNGSHFNSVNMCRDGVIISTSRMILAARFCNFNSLRVFPLEHLPHIRQPYMQIRNSKLCESSVDYIAQ